MDRLAYKPDLLAGQIVSASPLDLGLIPEALLADALNTTTRTLRRLEAERKGPKRVVIKRKIFYRRESVLEWLAAQERPAIETRTRTARRSSSSQRSQAGAR
jgi:hypothetical protein